MTERGLGTGPDNLKVGRILFFSNYYPMVTCAVLEVTCKCNLIKLTNVCSQLSVISGYEHLTGPGFNTPCNLIPRAHDSFGHHQALGNGQKNCGIWGRD